MMITRSQIRQNRQIWIDFLMDSNRKKAKGLLARKGEHRCCLGHACYVFDNEFLEWNKDDYVLPCIFVETLGLYNNVGLTQNSTTIELPGRGSFNTLADINDRTNATPQEIGAYLLSVIEGGPDTPFSPLSEFLE